MAAWASGPLARVGAARYTYAVEVLPPGLAREWRDLVDARTAIHHDLCGAAGLDEDPVGEADELGPRAAGCTCGAGRVIASVDAALSAAAARLAA